MPFFLIWSFLKSGKQRFCFCFSSRRSRTPREKRKLERFSESKSCKKDALEDLQGTLLAGKEWSWEDLGRSNEREEIKLGENWGAGAAKQETGPDEEVGARECEGHGSAPGLGRSFSSLSPWFSAWGNVTKHFLPLCHWTPPSFSMEELLSFCLGTYLGGKVQLFSLS